ncbi:MAG TPA: hypothetical protein VM689_10615 [Aliidongia sp.]|nr:hypothetical protein [Aliidongia sp.]
MSEPPDNKWKRHHAEMDAAVAADKAAAERHKAEAAEKRSGDYSHPLTILVGFVAFAALLLLCLYIIGQLEHNPLSSDCALTHGRGC